VQRLSSARIPLTNPNRTHFFLPDYSPLLLLLLLCQQQLWHAYLQERYAAVRDLRITEAAYGALNNTFERALVTLHKMPKIWELYLKFLVEQQDVTSVRQTCNRALASLPVTQHDRIWTIYLVSMPCDFLPLPTICFWSIEAKRSSSFLFSPTPLFHALKPRTSDLFFVYPLKHLLFVCCSHLGFHSTKWGAGRHSSSGLSTILEI